MSKTIEIQIHFLEILVPLLGKVNAGINRAQEVINSALDVCQYRATKALNNRLERLASDLLTASVMAAHEPHFRAAEYDRELEQLARDYEKAKAQVESDRALTLSQHNLTVAQEISDAYLAERRELLNRKK